jgi:hypothetical protein
MRACCLAILWFLTTSSSPAQLPVQASDLEPITVRLLVPNPRVCIGQRTLKLEAVLTNNTQRTVEMSSDGVSHIVYIAKFQGGKIIREQNVLADIIPANWVRIASHQSVIVPFTQSIGPDDLFFGSLLKETGTFEIMVDVGIMNKNPNENGRFPNSNRSNNAMFMISDCSDEPTSGNVAPTSKPSQP